MKTYRSLILTLTITLSAFIAFGVFFSMPSPKGIEEEGFSSARVVEDLKVISKEPHSVAHPEERNRLLVYLTKRLEEKHKLSPILASLPVSLPSMPKIFYLNFLL